jgi:glycosyltransferase involved in cell wall biosynthesis
LEDPPDLVEFHDFNGLGYWALMRRNSLNLAATPIAVRMHGPIHLIAEHMEVEREDQAVISILEQEAYRMADAVIVPSRPMAEVVVERFQVEPSRVRIGEPPIPAVSGPGLRPASAPDIVCLGRLSEVKGSEDVLTAGLNLLAKHPHATLRFVGPGGWSVKAARPMEAHLRARIPDSLMDRVRFVGPVPREELGAILASAWMVVIPSRFETFCLAAHEARALGLPIIVGDIPAFRPYFSEATGAVVTDGTIPDLEAAMDRLIRSPDLRRSLADAPLPTYAEPLTPYTELEPRHPRAQAGLATTALKRVQQVLTPAGPEPSARQQGTVHLLDALPERLSSFLEPRLPYEPDFPAIAAWRRGRAGNSWVGELMAESWQGQFPRLPDPEISVVIPCFNQGEYLHDAIRSVLRQDFPSWEIIVVDDGSTDPGTRNVLRKLSYPRTTVIRQRNRGLSAARNAGMRLARGKLLIPLDADDELSGHFMSAMRAALLREPTAAFAHCWTRLFGDQNLIWVDRPYNAYQLLISNSLVGCVLMSKAAWLEVGGYGESMLSGNEDWDLWLRFLENGWGSVEVPRPLFRYRRHGISMSVGTEARFEVAREEMIAAHPELYERKAVKSLKSEWYPWVSVVVGPDTGLALLANQSLEDLEVIGAGGLAPGLTELCRKRGWPLRASGSGFNAAVAESRGKFLIDWAPVTAAVPDLLLELAEALESDDSAYAAAGTPGAHPVLWRRWALLDPDADLAGVAAVEVAGEGPTVPEAHYRGAFQHPRWSVDPAAYRRRVHQVRPETVGKLPEWLP